MNRINRILVIFLIGLVYGGFFAYTYFVNEPPHWLWVIVGGSLVIGLYIGFILLLYAVVKELMKRKQ